MTVVGRYLFTSWLWMLFGATQSLAFVVDVQDCQPFPNTLGPTIYEFDFDQFAIQPDVTVQVATSSYNDDITIAVTSDPRQANLIMADGLPQSDISICRIQRGTAILRSHDITTVKVERFAISPNIRVGTTINLREADYVLFNGSKAFTDAEAAAFFAVLWKRGQGQQRPTVTMYQLQYRQSGTWVGGPLFATAWECSDAQWAPGVIGARCQQVQVEQ
jgi:hypothetical protein